MIHSAYFVTRLQAAQAELKENGFGLLYFFFHFQQTSQQTPQAVIRSLVKQAAQQVFQVTKKFPSELRAIYSDHQNGVSEPSYLKTISLLRRILKLLPRSYIILDGLDEYEHGSSTAESVPSVLLKIAVNPELNCKLMITSRHSSQTWKAKFARISEISMESSWDDMRTYLSKAISQSDAPVCRLVNSDQKTKEETIKKILDRSGKQ